MSANTSIKEGGKGYPFGPVKALMVQGNDGKYYPWYPESERALGTLSVDKNGIYRASDKGVYGWSSVYVNVATTDSVTGKDPDTGEEVVVSSDPETGEITETVVPVEIRVIEPPTNPYGVYVDGQTITKDGMVVKAYGANGDEMQTVPIGEITINPTTATYDPNHLAPIIVGDGFNTPINPVGYMDEMVYCYRTIEEQEIQYDLITKQGTPPMYVCLIPIEGGDSMCTLIVSDSYAKVWAVIHESTSGHLLVFTISQTYTKDGKTVYYGYAVTNNDRNYALPESAANSRNVMDKIAWAVLYGEGASRGSVQEETVSWPRPGDGAILETTFDIRVGPHGGTGED